MNCAVHQDAEAVGYCRNCGKPMCPQCVRPVRDVLYCEDCLARLTGMPATAPPPVASYVPPMAAEAAPMVPVEPGVLAPARAGNPAVAFILGFFPGLGAVYNGEFNKALIHIVVFAAMIVGLSSGLDAGPEVALSLLLSGFVIYMAFDAMRTAQARRTGTTTVDPLESWSKNRPIGPIILIAVGGLLLLNNFDWFPFWRFSRMLWPLILIGVGLLMFRNRMERRQ
jgi:cell wall-active antibiotic response 4TMS protein YvqF/B-box zinc finger protein